ncbi:archease [Streptomyces sp. BRA346]|uniref:archease n=1 Tax=Streptomyces sp. BRA346 TaxID=2878199 RepID=UPI004063A795
MADDKDDAPQVRRRGESGHRAVPHTADVRIEAWGRTRERCLAEAALGMVECFTDVSAARATAVERVRLTGRSDEELLTALLEEVIFRLEVAGRLVVEVEADACDGALEVRLALAELAAVEIIGAVPKGVSWHRLLIGPDPYGWSCAVTVDV